MCSIDMPSSFFFFLTQTRAVCVCAELTWPLQTHVLSRSPPEVLSGRRTSCLGEEMMMAAQTYIEEERKVDRAARIQPYLNTITYRPIKRIISQTYITQLTISHRLTVMCR